MGLFKLLMDVFFCGLNFYDGMDQTMEMKHESKTFIYDLLLKCPVPKQFLEVGSFKTSLKKLHSGELT